MAALESALAQFSPRLPLAVAFSGGADSTALLLLCARRWPGQVWAIHVHHGLQSAADSFAQHCQNTCQSLHVSLVVRHVDARNAVGQSPEDAARLARYEAFRSVLHDEPAIAATTSLALGHHADDQAETLLLALSRGSGLPGLAAMPEQAERNGLTLYRPLLAARAREIRAWLDAQGMAYLSDPTNEHLSYTRNRIRAQVLPALDAALPGFRQTFARSARHAAQAQQVLEEVAATDLTLVGRPPGIRALQSLSRARQANVLRHWLRSCCGTTASTAQLEELLHQVDACRTRGQRIHIKVGTGFVRRSMNCLDWYNPEV